MDKLSHSYSITVQHDHIDELDHVNNVVWVQWIQDAAVSHWNTVIPDHIKEKYVWVIVRHEIDYRYAAKLHEEILVHTKVLGAERATSKRLVEFRRKSDMKLLVEAQTTWCMVDAHTFRPARITDEIKAIFLGE